MTCIARQKTFVSRYDVIIQNGIVLKAIITNRLQKQASDAEKYVLDIRSEPGFMYVKATLRISVFQAGMHVAPD